MLTITRDINVYAQGQKPIVNLSQYDDDFRLVFRLYTSNGTFTMPDGTTAQIQGTKTDGNGYSAAASVSGNTVTVAGHVQMTAAAGPNVFEIVTFYNNKRLSTINFILAVERAALDSDTVSSESVIKDLSNIPAAVEQAEAAADRAEEAARTLTIDPTLTQSGQAADAKVTGEEIDGLKEDLSHSQIVSNVDFSDRETGYYINNRCIKTALNGTFISAPVSVKKGQKIILYIASYTTFCIISKHVGGVYSPLLLGTATDYNNAYLYEYTATEDCDVCFSGYDRNDYYAKIILPVEDSFDAINTRVETLENMNRRTANVEPLEIGCYINSRGSKVPLGTATMGGVVTAPIYLEKGETLTIYAMSYNIMSAVALVVGNTYQPVVLGDDTYEEVYKPYTYKAEFDCFVVASGYSQLPPYGYIERKYEVEHLPFDNMLVGAGLASAYDTMGFIGDSISSGECYSNEGGTNVAHDIYSVSWGQYLAKMCGATGYNWSRGGQTSKTWIAEWSNNSSFTDHPCKMYVIGLGQNDGYDLSDPRAVPLGTSADVGTEAETFYGLYSKIILRVKEIQPKAHIFVITNIIQQIEDHGYNTAIRYMASYYDNVFLLDYYTYGQELLNSPLMLSQKRLGHYTALGYRLMAQYINSYIDWYMRNNPDKFTQIEFIGTEWSWT